MPEIITDNLDLWTSALLTKPTAGRGSNGKLEAYGIKKLRELILELAVRGKLVPQDPNDEPASVLLKSIAAEKEQLIKEKKLRKQASLPRIEEDDGPHELPKGWQWVRLGDICTKLTDGSHNPPSDSGEGYPMLSSQNVYNGEIDFSNPSRFVNEEDFEREDLRTQITPNDILLTIVASLGRSAVVPDGAPRFVLQRSVAVLQTKFDSHFLALQLVSPHCLRYYDTHGKGTAQKGIYLGKLALMEIAAPPLAEQHRIVAKVDELTALCDQLEQQQTDSLAAHHTLVETLLGTLTRVELQQEFSTAWVRIASHFDTLFTTEASIDQLKQTILQLAVMGKLVPQELAWTDTCLGELGDWAVGSGFPTTEQGKEGLEILFSKVSDMNLPENVKFIVTTNHTISEATAARLRVNVHAAGTVIFPKIGGAIATNKRRILTRPTAIDNNCLGMAPNEGVSTEWLYLVLSSIDFSRYQAGTSVPALAQGTLSKIPVGLPASAEQHSIVAKVDELMTLCDALKARLADAQTTQLHLADAIVEQAVC